MRFPFRLAENREFDVVGFGTNAVDYLIVVPEYPPFGSKIKLRNYLRAAGGEVATTMVGLQRLGLETCYVGSFGDDREGDFGLRTLRDEAVDVRFCRQTAGAKTQTAFILIDERNGERTVIWDRDEKLAFAAPDAPLEVAARGKILHLTPHDTEACAAMARAAKENKVIVSADVDDVFPGIEQLLPLVDVLISSAEFPAKFTGIENRGAALREVNARFGCAVTGMTLGANGSLLLCENRFVETNGFAVPGGCRDTTGAGDAFRVGFLYGLVTGETIETAARMANAVAALKCRASGAQTALPGRQELAALLDQ